MTESRSEHPSPISEGEIEELKRLHAEFVGKFGYSIRNTWPSIAKMLDALPRLLAATSLSRCGRDEAIEQAERAVREVINAHCSGDAFIMGGPAAIGASCVRAIRSLRVSADKEKDGSAAQVFYLCADCSSPVACRARKWCGSNHPDKGHPALSGRDEAIEEAAKVADRFANDIGKLGFGCKDRKDLRGAGVYFDQAKACRGVANAIRALVSAPKEKDRSLDWPFPDEAEEP